MGALRKMAEYENAKIVNAAFRQDIDTIKADIESCQRRIRTLQSETIHYITIKSNGKIEVVDKVSLEDTNEEIDRLIELASDNSDVLARLQAVLQGANYSSVRDLQTQERRVEAGIERTASHFQLDIANLLKSNYGMNPETVLETIEGRKLKDKADAEIASDRERLAAVSQILNTVLPILQEFKHSGLEVRQDKRTVSIVTRADVPGIEASDKPAKESAVARPDKVAEARHKIIAAAREERR
jgi:hypothetical protein